jgi:TfoX/Sxy family transcriptional regulator of competence genes
MRFFLSQRPVLRIQIKYSLLDCQAAQEILMAFNEALAERIRQGLARRKNIEEKKMFGGIGFLLNGNMLVGVWKDSLIVRLGPEGGDEALLEPHVREFDATGRAMKGWVLVDPEGIEGDHELSSWIQRAVKFVSKLPGK